MTLVDSVGIEITAGCIVTHHNYLGKDKSYNLLVDHIDYGRKTIALKDCKTLLYYDDVFPINGIFDYLTVYLTLTADQFRTTGFIS